MFHILERYTEMKSHSGENHYRCALCGEDLISGNHIKRHIKMHTLENPWHCNLCDLKRQMIIHEMVNPCALCVEEIYINHPKRYIYSHTGKFHITVLFNIQKNMIGNYFHKYSVLVMSSADKHLDNTLLHKV